MDILDVFTRIDDLLRQLIQVSQDGTERLINTLVEYIEVSKRNNNVYIIDEVPLTVEHDCYSVVIPTHVEVINYFSLDFCSSAYKYRINHGAWIYVDAETEIIEEGFDVESLDISNAVGIGTLKIYLEGIHKKVKR